MYRIAWKNISKIDELDVAFEAVNRFLKSIKEESDTNSILSEINLSEQVIIESASSFAGQIFRSNDTIVTPEIVGQITELNTVSEMLSRRGANISSQDKLVSDRDYLSQKVGLFKRTRNLNNARIQ
jgi:hypothetical protein